MNADQNVRVWNAKWAPKACDVCGSAESEILGKRFVAKRNRSSVFNFALTDAICRTCGFVYAAQVPDSKFLEAYYQDAFTTASGEKPLEPDFNAHVRLETIEKFLSPPGRVLEIGSNTGEFCQSLNKAGFSAVGVDPVSSAENANTKVGFVDETGTALSGAGKFDAVVSYYVLEHVTDARAWIQSWRPLLKDDGLLFLEVPNFYSSPRESLVHEHFLHFSPAHLSALLESLGFQVLDPDCGKASRPFGFCAVARKTSLGNVKANFDLHLLEHGRQAYKLASELNAREDAAYEALATHIRQLYGPVNNLQFICWGANRFAARTYTQLVEQLGAKDISVVDNSLQKIGVRVEDMPIPVSRPDFSRKADKKRVFLLCSPSHNPAIQAQISSLHLEAIEILDTITWLNRFDAGRAGATAGQLISQRAPG